MSEDRLQNEARSPRDRVLDAYVRAIVAGEPDAQFRARVLARIDLRRGDPTKRWLAPPVLVATMAMVIVLAGGAWWAFRAPGASESARRDQHHPGASQEVGRFAQRGAPTEETPLPTVQAPVPTLRPAERPAVRRAVGPGVGRPGSRLAARDVTPEVALPGTPPPLVVSALEDPQAISFEAVQVDAPALAPIRIPPLDVSTDSPPGARPPQ